MKKTLRDAFADAKGVVFWVDLDANALELVREEMNLDLRKMTMRQFGEMIIETKPLPRLICLVTKTAEPDTIMAMDVPTVARGILALARAIGQLQRDKHFYKRVRRAMPAGLLSEAMTSTNTKA